MAVTQEKMESALRYLAETDLQYGQARAAVDGLDYRIKMAEAQGYIDNLGQGTQEHIKSLARLTDDYKKLVNEYIEMKTLYETIGAKRKTGELIIEVWRSVSANQRRGNV